MTSNAFDELAAGNAFVERLGDARLVTVFGSSRLVAGDPLLSLARRTAAAFAADDYLVLTGAGPGIMAAAAEGAGREHAVGIDIDLPSEPLPEGLIDPSRLFDTTRFYVRKVLMTKPADAFVVFPGGIGTFGELFEILNLLFTGKLAPAPVNLMDLPGGIFWGRFQLFLEQLLVGNRYMSPDNFEAVRQFAHPVEAVEEVRRFYRNYRGYERVGDAHRFRLAATPTLGQMDDLSSRIGNAVFTVDGERAVEFHLPERNYPTIRRVIDVINTW